MASPVAIIDPQADEDQLVKELSRIIGLAAARRLQARQASSPNSEMINAPVEGAAQ
jgi:hypothetical protein